MARERDDCLDPTQPTLIVQHGNTPRKYRRLEKEVLVLGRAPGCDLGLEAPEVAPVHCVIVRSGDGWRVRDCTGRGGTRVNGQSIQEETLADEDVLQIGSFCFAFHLPPARPRLPGFGGPTADAAVGRLRRSRQRFARLALRMRGRLRKAAAEVAARVEERLAARQDELDRQAEELDALQSDLDARLGEMRQTRQSIAVETRALLERHERVEKDLKEMAERERAHQEAAAEMRRSLEIRAGELGSYAGHLRRTRQRLCDQEERLAVRWQEWLRERQEGSEQIAREVALLREQRSAIVRLMGQMRRAGGRNRTPCARRSSSCGEPLAERDAALAAQAESGRRKRPRDSATAWKPWPPRASRTAGEACWTTSSLNWRRNGEPWTSRFLGCKAVTRSWSRRPVRRRR